MRRQLRGSDPELRRRLWPTEEFGCKRVLFSSRYLPALQQAHVEVVTEPITRITAQGVVTADGREHVVDTLIFGTGFRAGEFVTPIEVRGRDGVELQEAWATAPSAHLGMSVPGFPNLFLMYGPNTNLGVGSIVTMIEAQARYIAQAATVIRDLPGAALEVTARRMPALDARCRLGSRAPSGRSAPAGTGRAARAA